MWHQCAHILKLHLTQTKTPFGRPEMAVASEKASWRVPPTILYIHLPNACRFTKGSCSLHLGSKLRIARPMQRTVWGTLPFRLFARRKPFPAKNPTKTKMSFCPKTLTMAEDPAVAEKNRPQCIKSSPLAK